MIKIGKSIYNNKYFFLLVSLILSSFAHLFNPTGWPGLYYDEAIYMRRAMHLMNGLGPQEDPSFYDHPYFGQFFLAGIFSLIGFPHIISSQIGNTTSIEMLYFVPRIIMGLIAIIDTFLIFQISERLYNKKVALISSVIFGVTPLSWLLRWILLDSILLPFLLLAILLAIISNNYLKRNERNSGTILFISSGLSLGLAIFTKIPAFVIIPLTGYLIFKNTDRSAKRISLWLLFVILIPMIWPAYSIINGQFINWVTGVYYQTHRESQPLVNSFQTILFKDDPVFLILGIAGLIMAVLKKDLVILLWIIPFFLFLYVIGWVSLYHWIPLIPAFSIAIGVMIEEILKIFQDKKIIKIFFSTFTILLVIGSIDLVGTTSIITRNVNLAHFEAAAHLYSYLSNIKNNSKTNSNANITVIADPFYLWIAKYIFKLNYDYKPYYNVNSIGNRTILVIDRDLRNIMSKNDELSKKINEIYHSKPSYTVYIARDPKVAYNVTIIDYPPFITNPKSAVRAIENNNKVIVAAANSANH
jgi:hypothetical protein